MITRREAIKAVALTAGALTVVPSFLRGQTSDSSTGSSTYPFKLAPLGYPYDALEPYIDALTMQIHHDKHNGAYVDNLNKALAGKDDLLKKDIHVLLREIDKLPEAIRTAVINNGGGHANHMLFWHAMTPNKADQQVPAAVSKAIDGAFESMDKFKTKLTEEAMKRFGSGWAWLVADQKGKLEVYSTANQESPLMKGHTPLLGLDVWEHAYYLKYHNVRKDYVDAIWNVINWSRVSERYAKAASK